MKNIQRQSGFTLIELVVVIVILGILAATAAPKFIDLQDDAKSSTLQAIKGSMESAATLVHSKSLIAGNEDSETATVSVNEDAAFPIAYGYPRSNDAIAATNWQNKLLDIDTNEFTIAFANDAVIVRPAGMDASAVDPTAVVDSTDPDTYCYASYTEVDAENDTPAIKSVDC